MTRPEAEPMFPIPAVYLIPGKAESPDGPVKKLHAVLEQHWPGFTFIRPDIPFYDPKDLQMLQSKRSCGTVSNEEVDRARPDISPLSDRCRYWLSPGRFRFCQQGL
jgi:hypothetical protein